MVVLRMCTCCDTIGFSRGFEFDGTSAGFVDGMYLRMEIAKH